ncbi:flavodoxin family protein [Breznakiella homolactica]|uniref:Flavodoxin family protein n=1 Tax=Breznakiella homolactica TaxID=2798577 RepID=A0A7T7XLW3_9SPIR|nr:flavodoxin family protein [Breznakiella homolactica]QQO08638.1 flavodoxin family protein [Breznakiella homolactica]
MNVLLINGSPRKNGATAKILAEIEHRLTEHIQANCELVNISELDLEFCRGCSGCYRTGACFIPDNAENLSGKIARADIVVFGSPTYVSGISGQMKTFVDRGHFVIEQLLTDTYTLSVVTYENADGSSAAGILEKLCIFSGAVHCGNITARVSPGQNPLAVRRIEKKVAAAVKRLSRAALRRKKRNLVQAIIHSAVFNIGIKPFILKKPDAYTGVLEHWKKRGIGGVSV